MLTVCEKNKCVGCMACVDICSKKAIEIRDEVDTYNAVINGEKCIQCNLCHEICQCNHTVELFESIGFYQGWAENRDVRSRGSSGGASTALANAFLDIGDVVCSCVFADGEFVFKSVQNKSELDQFAGSKYVKSNPVGTYIEINQRLKRGQKALFIGLPCQVAAVKNYIQEDLHKSLYTIDLICHGTPSPKLFERYISQTGYELSKVKDIKFRSKGYPYSLREYEGLKPAGIRDRYTIAFLSSIANTESCYHCSYAKTKRVADISLGDSWGSDQKMSEKEKGVSLILVQSDKGNELLKRSMIHIENVDVKNAIEKNLQLSAPPKMPKHRNEFLDKIKKGGNISRTVFRYLPFPCFRQDVKEFLFKTKVFRKRKGMTNYGIEIQRTREL